MAGKNKIKIGDKFVDKPLTGAMSQEDLISGLHEWQREGGLEKELDNYKDKTAKDAEAAANKSTLNPGDILKMSDADIDKKLYVYDEGSDNYNALIAEQKRRKVSKMETQKQKDNKLQAQADARANMEKNADASRNKTSGNTKASGVNLLDITPEQYQADYTADQVVNAAKNAGWSEDKTREYLTHLSNGKLSDFGTNAMSKYYGNTEASEAKVEEKPVETAKPTLPQNISDMTSEQLLTSMEEVSGKDKLNLVNQVNDNINSLEGQLKDPNLDNADRAALEAQLRNLKTARTAMRTKLNWTPSDIKRHYDERKQFEEFVTKKRAGNFIAQWVEEASEAQKVLDRAKKSGNKDDIAAAKKALWDVSKEYGFFLVSGLGTALKNMSIPGAYGRAMGNEVPAFRKKQLENLQRETERWNAHWDDNMKNIEGEFSKRFSNESREMDAFNELMDNEALQLQAKQLGLLDKTFEVEGVLKMQDILKTKSTAETLAIMSMLNYDTDDKIFQWLSTSGVDLDALANTVANTANTGIEAVDGAVTRLDGMLSWLEGKMGGNK